MSWLQTKDWAKNVITVHQSEAVVQAQGEGKSVVQVDRYGVIRDQVLRLCRMVSEAVSLPRE